MPRGDAGNSQAQSNPRHLPRTTPCQGMRDPSSQQGTGVSSPACQTAGQGPELPDLPGLAEASPPTWLKPRSTEAQWQNCPGGAGRRGTAPGPACSHRQCQWLIQQVSMGEPAARPCPALPGLCSPKATSQAVNMCHGCDLPLPTCRLGWATRSPARTLCKAPGTSQATPSLHVPPAG